MNHRTLFRMRAIVGERMRLARLAFLRKIGKAPAETTLAIDSAKHVITIRLRR